MAIKSHFSSSLPNVSIYNLVFLAIGPCWLGKASSEMETSSSSFIKKMTLSDAAYDYSTDIVTQLTNMSVLSVKREFLAYNRVHRALVSKPCSFSVFMTRYMWPQLDVSKDS